MFSQKLLIMFIVGDNHDAKHYQKLDKYFMKVIQDLLYFLF